MATISLIVYGVGLPIAVVVFQRQTSGRDTDTQPNPKFRSKFAPLYYDFKDHKRLFLLGMLLRKVHVSRNSDQFTLIWLIV